MTTFFSYSWLIDIILEISLRLALLCANKTESEWDCTACSVSAEKIVLSIPASLPALWFPSFPDQPPQAVSRDPSSKFKQKTASCWTLCNVVGLLTLFLFPCIFCCVCTWNSLSLPPFLTSWSAVFLTAVQPLLSDGLFCCLKHLIGGQVYIIRGESLSLSQSEVLFLYFLYYLHGCRQLHTISWFLIICS